MIERLLAHVPLFSSLPSSELEHLAATLLLRDVPSGMVLFRDAEIGSHFYVVVSGLVEIVKAMETGEDRVLGVRGPGEFVGEMSLLTRDGRRTATVRAVEACQLLEMTRADFDALLHRRPLIAYDMVRVLSERLSASNVATINDLQQKNRELARAYTELQAAQVQIIEKERLDRELNLAHEIQVGMLPRAVPRWPGYDFCARLRPARAVGGDFFDFLPRAPGVVGLVVGDVAGKGMPAALFMALSSALLRAEAAGVSSPGAALRRVNQHLLTMNEAGLFVTVFYGCLDLATGQLVYARAGHELPHILNANGEVWCPPLGRGQPLGVFDEPYLDEQSLDLPPGATLLLYSDGVTDAQDPARQMFGPERLHSVLASQTGQGATALCGSLLQSLLDFQGPAPQHDDITLLAVSRQP